MKRLAVLTVLAGCAAPPLPAAPAVTRIYFCADPVPTPAPPPAPRTINQIIAWSGRLVRANDANVAALRACPERLGVTPAASGG